MKKLIFVLMGILLFFSCNPTKDFVKQAKEDYAVAVNEADTAYFYEVQVILDKPVNEIDDQLNIISTRTVIQENGLRVKFIDRNYSKGKIYKENVEITPGLWLGDMPTHLDSIKFSFNDAIKQLKKTNTILPESNKVTFRRPAFPPFKSVYVFGSLNTFFVTVDAITGEVNTFDAYALSGFEI